jgi:hypothetical protein
METRIDIMKNFLNKEISSFKNLDKVSKLPFYFIKKGFDKIPNPTLYSPNDDLEIITVVKQDKILFNKEQDNFANAQYLSEASFNYPRALNLINKIFSDNNISIEQQEIYLEEIGLTSERKEQIISMLN